MTISDKIPQFYRISENPAALMLRYASAVKLVIRRIERNGTSERAIDEKISKGSAYKVSYATINNIHKNPSRPVSRKTMIAIVRAMNPAPPKRKKRVPVFSMNGIITVCAK